MIQQCTVAMTVTKVVVLVLFCVLVCFMFAPTSAILEGIELKVYKCANGSAKTTELCLKKDLLKDYDTGVRPVAHHSNQTTVYMALFPMRISINIRWLRVLCWVQKSWVDELLKWDPREYQNLQQLAISPASIWQPDVHPLPLKGSDSGWTSSSAATVVSSGTVTSIETVTYYTYCDSDISRWPYESYLCVLTLQSQAYKGPELNIFIMDHKTPELKYFVPDPSWTVVSMSSARISSEAFETKYFVVNLEYSFVIKRNAAMFVTTAIFPAIVFSVTQLAFLRLDKECSARLILCSMLALTHYFFLNFGTSNIPSESDTIPYIVKFYKYSLLLSTCVIVWTIAVRSLCSLATFPYWLYNATLRVHNNRILNYLMPFDGNLPNSTNLDREDARTLVELAECENRQWRNMAEFLDRIVFFICLSVYIFLYITYVP